MKSANLDSDLQAELSKIKGRGVIRLPPSPYSGGYSRACLEMLIRLQCPQFKVCDRTIQRAAKHYFDRGVDLAPVYEGVTPYYSVKAATAILIRLNYEVRTNDSN